MKEKKHGQSVRSVRCENGWEAHSIADVCSMKEKNARQVFAVLTHMEASSSTQSNLGFFDPPMAESFGLFAPHGDC